MLFMICNCPHFLDNVLDADEGWIRRIQEISPPLSLQANVIKLKDSREFLIITLTPNFS